MKRFGTNQAAKDLAAVHIDKAANNDVPTRVAAKPKQTAEIHDTRSVRMWRSVIEKLDLIMLYKKTGKIDVDIDSRVDFISSHLDKLCDEILKDVK